ncbi:unnamed protein product [Enterobius vermicularis]|uniref:F-box domain-containing protein n=1 Tax=Enterobius vermicularis TaxID=51028 RepID=A0A0N4VDC5_ENTVE|nr:unnamed protein product [Enterobius vermicularis]
MPLERKRKIIATSDGPPAKDKKLDVSEPETESDSPQPALLDLPLLALSGVISNLSFKDQGNFERVCTATRRAVKYFWKSQTLFDYYEFTNRLFKLNNDSSNYPLACHHIALQQLPHVLSLYSNYALRDFSFRTLPLLTAEDLDVIVASSNKSTAEIFSGVRSLDLRDVCLNYEELNWFSLACPLLSSLKVTFNAVAMDTL